MIGRGLAKWVRSPGSNDRSRTPTSTYRGSRNLMTLSVLVVGMMAVLMSGLLALMFGDMFGHRLPVACSRPARQRLGRVGAVAAKRQSSQALLP